jgi:hypothetical protein
MAGHGDKRGRGRSPHSAATQVAARVRGGGERYWAHADFRDLPPTAVAHALSRLTASGELQRVRKGIYYRPKQTVLGPSVASGAALLAQTAKMPLHPAGLTAGTALGLTTQNPAHPEFATPASAVPAGLNDATVHTRRPLSRTALDDLDGAVLELLRDGARQSDLSARATTRRLVSMLSEPGRFKLLADAALHEPPRVRAMLGALGERANAPDPDVDRLRKSLNPLSKFDFGLLRSLPNAKDWQAR